MHLWLRRVAYLLRQSRHEAELREEIEAHRRLRQAQLERGGLAPSAAEDGSRRALGNILLAREESREAWLGSWDTWWQDVRYSARMIRRNPGTAVVVTLTMATAIGMNAAIFGVFHAVLLRPLPHPDPERLAWLTPHSQRFNIDTMVSRPDFLIWRERAKSFERMAAYGQVDVAFLTSGQASEEQLTLVSHDFWAMTGATPELGRLFGPDEQNAIVLTHRMFEQKFNGKTDVLGTTVSLNGYPLTIVGVLARDYRVAFPTVSSEYRQDSTAYIALPNTPSQPGAADRIIPGGRPVSPWVRVVGKLRPDASIERARTEFQGIFDQIARDFPTPLREGRSHRVVPLLEKVVSPVETPLKILLVAVALLLMIATTNIAHLLLARSLSRQAEIAIRISLGAGRTRILRQLFSESLLLAVMGCGAGLALAQWTLHAVVRLWPDAVPRLEGAVINAQVLTYAVVAALVSTVLFGMAPAIALLRTDLTSALKREDKTTSPTTAVGRIRGVLVTLELTFATTLLIAAGLMFKSFWLMTARPPGFDPEKTLVTRVSLSGPRYASRIPQEQYVHELLQRVQGLPGVSAVGIDAGSFNSPVKVDGGTSEASESVSGGQPFVTFKPVSLGFLRAVGVPLIRGRWPSDDALSSDAIESTDALLVNQRFADTVLRGQEPIGRHVAGPYVSGTIAAVVADFKDWQLDAEPLPQVYVPFKRSMVLRSVRVVVRTHGDPVTVAPSVREAIARIYPTQAVAESATLDEVLGASISNRRFSLRMLALFAAVALLLALTGAYGVVAHSVGQRTREIGIRIALGGRPREVIRLVVRREMAFAAAGIALGVVGTFALAPLLDTVLYDVAPRDVATFAAVTLAMAAAATLTSWSAAARAASVDPVNVLRRL
jgi:putative ABC transport system permease protein